MSATQPNKPSPVPLDPEGLTLFFEELLEAHDAPMCSFVESTRRKTSHLAPADRSVDPEPQFGIVVTECDSSRFVVSRFVSGELHDGSILAVILRAVWQPSVHDCSIELLVVRYSLEEKLNLVATIKKGRVRFDREFTLGRMARELRLFPTRGRLKWLDLDPLHLDHELRAVCAKDTLERLLKHSDKVMGYGPVALSEAAVQKLLEQYVTPGDPDDRIVFVCSLGLLVAEKLNDNVGAGDEALSSRLHLGMQQLIAAKSALDLFKERPLLSATLLKALAIARFERSLDTGVAMLDLAHFVVAFMSIEEVEKRPSAWF